MSESEFPPGTPVRVIQTVARTAHPPFSWIANLTGTKPRRTPGSSASSPQEDDGDIKAEIFGVVEAWEERPTGSWHAAGRDGKLWLRRLRLRKADGEVTILVIDDGTRVAKLEAVAPAGASTKT